jgi:hypothetical protein
MKKIISLILLPLAITAHIHGMDHQARNNNIGPIDKLVLAHAISQKGLPQILEEVRAHDFDKTILGKPNPWSIVFRCEKNNGSELSATIFSTIKQLEYSEIQLSITNEFNKRRTAIDECSRYAEIKDGSKDKQITTSFHNEAVLLQAIEELGLQK